MFEDGIYFGLPEDDYHKIERLSNSGIQMLNVSPADFWATSWLNPHKEETEDTNAQILGRAYHCARLEPKAFTSRFVRKPSKADYENIDGFLSTQKDVEAGLQAMGKPKKKKGEGASEQAYRLALSGYEGPIWHLIEAEHNAGLFGRTPIEGKFFDEIIRDMGQLRKVSAFDRLLSGGAAEVSILWTCPETGIKMKCRVDYLRPDSWSDLKTFANPNRKQVRRAITDALMYNRYYLQPALYREALELVRAGALDVMGEVTQEEQVLVDEIREQPGELEAWIIYIQKGVPNVFLKRFPFFHLPVEVQAQTIGISDEDQAQVDRTFANMTQLHLKARAEIQRAKADFAAYQQIYEPGEPWFPPDPVGEFTDEDFPPYWLERGFDE